MNGRNGQHRRITSGLLITVNEQYVHSFVYARLKYTKRLVYLTFLNCSYFVLYK
jgi:hypothetical protein